MYDDLTEFGRRALSNLYLSFLNGVGCENIVSTVKLLQELEDIPYVDSSKKARELYGIDLPDYIFEPEPCLILSVFDRKIAECVLTREELRSDFGFSKEEWEELKERKSEPIPAVPIMHNPVQSTLPPKDPMCEKAYHVLSLNPRRGYLGAYDCEHCDFSIPLTAKENQQITDPGFADVAERAAYIGMNVNDFVRMIRDTNE